MVVLVLENVPNSLRGQITRWLLEVKAGVFVGKVSAMVRDKLWDKVRSNCSGGTCLMIWSSQTEQGFDIEFWGAASRVVTEWEGIKLMTKHP
ncbi:MAG: CRISPR-associated endoribonuclease Cas2 [Candidatus Cloacimonetes bacterium ADurb.Bin088]|nr:MAG: CRISPR-associated endoribonuclease Cas2 [Candidatus Cloacimonetes bacterium ADurb.Bin088]